MNEQSVENYVDAGGPPAELFDDFDLIDLSEPETPPEEDREAIEAVDGGGPPDWLLQEVSSASGEEEVQEPDTETQAPSTAVSAGAAPEWVDDTDIQEEGEAGLASR